MISTSATASAVLAAFVLVACAEPEHPNVVLVVVDTLRKDALHLYGNDWPTSTSIDALAASGLTFDNHIAHASQTVPSMLSLLLSRLPAEHGLVHNGVGQFSKQRPHYPDDFLFLAEVFHRTGYRTGGWVANPFLTRENGFDQGFDRFEHVRDSSRSLTRSALDWLDAWSKERARPFFAYLHYMDPHQPYQPPKRELERFTRGLRGKALQGNRALTEADRANLAYTRAVYRAAVANADAQIGAIVKKVRELGVAEKTIFVVTADHGEEFGEHDGIGHGTTVYGELVRVPLVISYPSRTTPPRRVGDLTQHVDLGPTLLSLAGIDAPPEFHGRSVLEHAERVFTEDGPWRAVYAGEWKLIANLDTGERALFHAADELDQHRVEGELAPEALRRALDDYVSRRRARPSDSVDSNPEWSPDELEHLRALGYAR